MTHSASTQPNSMLGPTRTERLLPAIFILVSDGAAIALLYLHLSGWRGSFEAAKWITQNRTVVGIAVQLVSHALGLAMIQTLCTILNLSTRVLLASSGVSLDLLRLANTVCGMRIDWSLSYKHLPVVLLWTVAMIVPGALWAGALTPLITSSQHTQALAIPAFQNGTGITTLNFATRNESIYKVTDKGTFTFAPDRDLQDLILNSAEDASDRRGNFNQHRKLDKTGYVYQGRSYGTSSAVGLSETFDPPATTYEFDETGLLAETHCIRNATSDWFLEPFNLEDLTLKIYNARGTLPNGSKIIRAATSLSDNDAFAVGAEVNEIGQPYYVVFATADWIGANSTYAKLSHVQCEIVFTPTSFGVRVNTTARTIDVHPKTTVEPFSNSDVLAVRTVNFIGSIGSILATTCWMSVFGEVFRSNIINVEAYNNISDASTFTAVAMSLNSIVDSFLEAISAAQMEVSHDTQTVHALTASTAIVIGASKFIFAIVGLSICVTSFYIGECMRTKFWAEAAALNFMDMKSTIVAASAGGTGLAKRANRSVHLSKDSNRPPRDGNFKVVAQDAQSGRELLVMAAEAYDLVSFENQ